MASFEDTLFPRLDAVPPLAFSTRVVVENYAGPAFRVRRDDGQEQDIGFLVNGDLDAAALLGFAGPGDAVVVTWYNQGHGPHAVVEPGATGPRLVVAGELQRTQQGSVAVAFSGTPLQYLAADWSATTNLIVRQTTSATSAQGYGLLYGDDRWTTEEYRGSRVTSFADGRIAFAYGNGPNDARTAPGSQDRETWMSNPSAIDVGAQEVVYIVGTSDIYSPYLYLDNVRELSFFNSGTGPTGVGFRERVFTLGGSKRGVDPYLGVISEVFVWNTPSSYEPRLDETTRTALYEDMVGYAARTTEVQQGETFAAGEGIRIDPRRLDKAFLNRRLVSRTNQPITVQDVRIVRRYNKPLPTPERPEWLAWSLRNKENQEDEGGLYSEVVILFDVDLAAAPNLLPFTVEVDSTAGGISETSSFDIVLGFLDYNKVGGCLMHLSMQDADTITGYSSLSERLKGELQGSGAVRGVFGSFLPDRLETRPGHYYGLRGDIAVKSGQEGQSALALQMPRDTFRFHREVYCFWTGEVNPAVATGATILSLPGDYGSGVAITYDGDFRLVTPATGRKVDQPVTDTPVSIPSAQAVMVELIMTTDLPGERRVVEALVNGRQIGLVYFELWYEFAKQGQYMTLLGVLSDDGTSGTATAGVRFAEGAAFRGYTEPLRDNVRRDQVSRYPLILDPQL